MFVVEGLGCFLRTQGHHRENEEPIGVPLRIRRDCLEFRDPYLEFGLLGLGCDYPIYSRVMRNNWARWTRN